MVSDVGQEDIILPFAVEPLSTRGRVVRLGPAIDAILKRHAYPSTISRIVGEAAALTVLLGSALKIDGSFQLQTQTDGALNMLVVDFDAPSNLRALARFDPAKITAARDARAGELLGRGHLAFTIDPGAGMSRYQGVVPLDGQGLEEAAHQYFRRSEQIPTIVRLAVGEIVTPGSALWRAGGMVAQFLPESIERRRQADLDPGDAPEGAIRDFVAEDEVWSEARALVGSLEDHELIDPTLSSERLLYRLFHERGVKVFKQGALRDVCRCSTQRIETMLQRFSAQERRDMVGEDGKIGVTCEFCSTKRVCDPSDFAD
jgi:molecular chaperone Hsp33